MTSDDETTLVIRLPSELKSLFQTLCKLRGTNISEELRRFIADSITDTATGMTTKDRLLEPSDAKKALTVKNRESSRCNNTSDLFDAKKPVEACVSYSKKKHVQVHNKVAYDATGAKIRQSDTTNGVVGRSRAKKK